MSIGCLANWFRNRSFHCVITGPLFLIAGVIFLFSEMHLIYVDTRWVWPLVLIAVAVAFVLECRFARCLAS
jgi:O-antigen ligase